MKTEIQEDHVIIVVGVQDQEEEGLVVTQWSKTLLTT